jgi:hypothetical protein
MVRVCSAVMAMPRCPDGGLRAGLGLARPVVVS